MSLARHLAVMRNAPFLRPLGDDALRLLAFGSLPTSLKPRQVLFEAGDEANDAVVVLGGQLRLVSSVGPPDARIVGVGQLVDELALIVPVRRSSTAVAQTSCEVLRLPRDQMGRILPEFPEAAAKLKAHVERRLATLADDVGGLMDRQASER